MTTVRLAAAAPAVTLVSAARAATEDFTVDESTGEAVYTYRLDLPAARGRYQPSLALVNRSGTNDTLHPGDGIDRWDLQFFGGPRLTGFFLQDGPHSGRAFQYSARTGGGVLHLAAAVEESYFDVQQESDWTFTGRDAAGNVYRYLPGVPGSAGRFIDTVMDPDGNTTQWVYFRDATGMPTATQEIRYNSYTRSDGTLGFATRVSFSGDLRNGGDIRIIIENPDPAQPATTLRRYALTRATDPLLANRPFISAITEYAGESGPSRVSTFTMNRAFPGESKTDVAVSQTGVRYRVDYVSSDGGSVASNTAHGWCPG